MSKYDVLEHSRPPNSGGWKWRLLVYLMILCSCDLNFSGNIVNKGPIRLMPAYILRRRDNSKNGVEQMCKISGIQPDNNATWILKFQILEDFWWASAIDLNNFGEKQFYGIQTLKGQLLQANFRCLYVSTPFYYWLSFNLDQAN